MGCVQNQNKKKRGVGISTSNWVCLELTSAGHGEREAARGSGGGLNSSGGGSVTKLVCFSVWHPAAEHKDCTLFVWQRLRGDGEERDSDPLARSCRAAERTQASGFLQK